MEKVIKQKLINAFANSFEAPYTGSLSEWAYQYVKLPNNYAVTGRFDVSISRYLVQPMEDLLDKNVVQVNVFGAAQTAKSTLGEVFIPYIIINDPGPILKLHQTDDMSNYFSEARLNPLLQNCVPVKNIFDLEKIKPTKDGFELPTMMCKLGSGINKNLWYGSTIRYLQIDEGHQIIQRTPECIKRCKIRTTAYGNNKKILLTSTPSIEGDSMWDEMTGKIMQWSWHCKACNNHQLWHWSKELPEASAGGRMSDGDGRFAGILWDNIYKNEESSSLNYELTGENAKLYCEHCSASYSDNEINRQYFNNSGKYLMTQDNGDNGCHTYQWPVFVNSKISFKSKVIEYLQAIAKKKQTGLTDDLRDFEQQTMGHFWRRGQTIDAAKIMAVSFNPLDDWKECLFRCIAVDYQRKNETKFYVVCGFSQTEIRVLEHSYCHKWDDIEALQKKWKIPSAAVFIDSGFNAGEVYNECWRHSQPVTFGKRIELYGWWPLKGDGNHESYSHTIGNDKVKKYYSPETKIALNNNQFVRLINWANLPIKSMLFHIRERKSDIKLVLPTSDPVFDEHMNAESLEWISDKSGLKTPRWIKKSDNNHWLDCMCMAIVGANMRNVYTTSLIDTVSLISALSGSLEK